MSLALSGALLYCAFVASAQAFNCPLPPPGNFVCGNPEFENCGIDVSGVTRHFCIHQPAQPQSGPPVVWGFHGGTKQASVMVGHLADQTEQGMVLVAPTALPSTGDCGRRWRHLGRDRPDWAALDTGQDACAASPTPDNDADLHFVEVLLDEIDAQVEGDVAHYALGFSNGAGMVYQLMITAPLSARFSAFAMLANAMNEAKLAASAGGSSGPWSAETELAHPVMVQQGTADRLFVPIERMAERTAALAAQAAGTGSICDMAVAPTVEKVFACWMSQPMAPGMANNDYIDRGLQTRLWLIRRNNTAPRALEGIYPDRGHGRDSALNQEDATVTVRREWQARRAEGSQPVVWLNTIDAAHSLSGSRGAYPPCENRNCDLDTIREVLQFWRANAGFLSPWR